MPLTTSLFQLKHWSTPKYWFIPGFCSSPDLHCTFSVTSTTPVNASGNGWKRPVCTRWALVNLETLNVTVKIISVKLIISCAPRYLVHTWEHPGLQSLLWPSWCRLIPAESPRRRPEAYWKKLLQIWNFFAFSECCWLHQCVPKTQNPSILEFRTTIQSSS